MAPFFKKIDLDDDVKSFGLIEKAHVFRVNADTWSRIAMIGCILIIFIGLNSAVMYFIFQAFEQDTARFQTVANLRPEDRLVTTSVVLSLIGATVVQVGSAIAMIALYLFPRKLAILQEVN
jgi:hypothetical protein